MQLALSGRTYGRLIYIISGNVRFGGLFIVHMFYIQTDICHGVNVLL